MFFSHGDDSLALPFNVSCAFADGAGNFPYCNGVCASPFTARHVELIYVYVRVL